MNMKTVKALAASAVAAIAGAVSGTTYNVPADGTLNEVVPAAQSGDEVVIAASETPYVLTAALTVPAGVTVRGATGDRKDVVVSGGGACAGLTLTQGTSESVLTAISNLTITSCASTGGTAGLVVKKWAVVENCRVTGCWATGQAYDGVSGIGVNLAANSAVKRCVIDGNYTLDTYDGLKAVGLYVSGASTVSDTVITNNYAPKMRTSDWSRMGSAGVRAAKGATFTRCYFANNRIGLVTTGANSVGTALFVDDYAYLYNCTFEHNDYECAVADNVYAVILASNSNTKMENCVILENRQTDGALNNISIGASCADAKFSNNASDGVLESIESKVSIVVTEDDFVRVGGLLRPKPNTPASGLGAMPDWDGVTPADPLPPAPSTNLVSDITLLQAAIDAAKPGDVVLIAKGTYTVTAQINVRNGVIVEGATGNRDDVILDGNNACRVVNVTGATLRHVTLTRGMSSEEACGGDAFVGLCGRLENCRATGILDYSKTMYAKGVVVYNNGGFVTGCLIDGNTVKASVRSIGYHQTYGAIDRSVIRNNKGIGVSPRSGFWIHAGFWIEGGGSMRNCIVTGNSQGTVSTSYSSGCGGSLGGNGSKMINCLVYDNTYSGIASTDMAGVVVGANATIVNSVVLGNGYVDTRAENFTGATRHMNNVTDKATADLCTDSFEGTIEDVFLVTDDGLDIKAGSDLVDAGIAQPVAEQGLDVCARPRLGGDRIDIGPFEYHVPPFAVTFESPVYFALDRIETTLTATASGDTEGTVYSWYLDAAETPFATGVDKQSVPLVLTELGTHTVTLKAVNGAGLADEFAQTYRVQQGTFVVNPGESIPDAIAAAEPGSTVLLKRGVHTNEALIVINKSIALRGESRNETIITGTNMVRGVSLTALGATLADLTITDCRGNDYLKGGCAGVRLEAGTIMTNCIVRNCSTGNRNSGVGVYSADGKIYDCIISNNVGGVGTGFYQTGGSALMCRTFVLGNRSGAQVGGDNGFSLAAGGVLEGGEIRDSVIARNVAIVDRWNSWDKCTCSASGVFVKGGKLVNCTVVENEHTTPDNTTEYDYEGLIGGVGRRDGTIVNCLIAENYNVTTGGRADISVAINSFLLGYSTTCASPLALMPADAGNVSSVPGPVYRYSKRRGEYRLTQGSPCAGAGTWQTWMAGERDIYGRAWNPDRVDIGAAVYDCKGLMLMLK